MTDVIKVTGLIELQRALKATGTGAQKELRLVLNEAAQVVVNDAKRRAPARSGKLRASIRAMSQQRQAVVSEGGSRVPYAGFIDYGGSVGRKHATKRPFVKTGRIIYPALIANEQKVAEMIATGLVGLARKNGLEVVSGQ